MRSGGRHPSSNGPARPPYRKQRTSTGDDHAALYGNDEFGFDLKGQPIGNTGSMLPSDIKKERDQVVSMKPVSDGAANYSPAHWERRRIIEYAGKRLHSEEDENEKLEKEALRARSAAPRGLSVKT